MHSPNAKESKYKFWQKTLRCRNGFEYVQIEISEPTDASNCTLFLENLQSSKL